MFVFMDLKGDFGQLRKVSQINNVVLKIKGFEKQISTLEQTIENLKAQFEKERQALIGQQDADRKQLFDFNQDLIRENKVTKELTVEIASLKQQLCVTKEELILSEEKVVS